MNAHFLKHVMSEIWLMVLLFAPVVAILATMIGLVMYSMGYHAVGLWTCATAFVACVVLGPCALRVLSRPDARVACECGGTRPQW